MMIMLNLIIYIINTCSLRSLKYSKIPSVEEDQTINYQENVDNIT